MRSSSCPSSNWRVLLAAITTFSIMFVPLVPVSTLAEAPSATEVLPSWNDGAAKQAIVDFVKATTDKSSPDGNVTVTRMTLRLVAD